MVKRNRLRNGRKQAQFGADGAIMAAATLAAAGIGAYATANSAKKQAEAMTQSAKTQADALAKQNENANKNQEQMIEFTREQNERNRDLQKDIQMNLQLLTGQQNTNELKDAAKIQVKHGGSMRRKLRNAYSDNTAYSLRGVDNNLPFVVTDGGGVIPIATTPEGYDLYEIVGNDHEHYHKTQGGRNKTGVGIKFAGGETIEGEGNQNGNQGELMLVTPNDAKFISRHTMKGFNPTDAVLSGMHPLEAFALQENIKNANGISDDGKFNSSTPVRSIRPYGGISTLNISPDLSLDFMAPVATGIVAGTRQEEQAKYGRSLKKCGGRRKAWNGTQWWNGLSDVEKGNIAGAGWSTVGNLGGALITTLGNNAASRYLTNGYNSAADILANAYGNLKTIDMSALNRNDFRAAHAMAALQAPIVQTGAERSAAERTLQRNLSRINRGTLSSAAAQNRSARAEIDYNDRISQIESNADKIRQGIIQGNMQRITETSAKNAELDTQANNAYTQAYLNLLQYNNDIANERITGAAQARADAITQNASTIAGTRQANASSWAGALTNGLGGIGNALATNSKMRSEQAMAELGASDDAIIRSIYNNPNSTVSRNSAYGIWMRYKNSNNTYYKDIADKLAKDYSFV